MSGNKAVIASGSFEVAVAALHQIITDWQTSGDWSPPGFELCEWMRWISIINFIDYLI
jgi:hypothetical protein